MRATLERGGCVVTADPHQAYQLRLAWAEHQQRQNRSGWASPDILSLDAAIVRAWQRALVDDPAPRPILLSAAQERTLWEQVVRSRRNEEFLQPYGTARAAQRSWRRLHAWNLDQGRSGAWNSEESRSFLQWARAFEQRCEALGVIDASRVLALTPAPLDRSRPWLLAGFDVVPPAVAGLLQRWRDAGIEIAIDTGPERDARVSRAGCSDRQAEWRAAALWARRRLLAAPGERLMIVISDLERERDLVERTFDEILQPASLTEAATPGSACYAIEGGVALSEYPLVATAIAAAALASEAQPFDVASAWWRSPYLLDGAARSADRARIDLRLRLRTEHELDASGLARGLDREAARLGIEDPLLARIKALSQRMAGRQGLARWSTQFSAALQSLGWPGREDRNSAEHQTLEKFKELLADLATLDELVGPVDAAGMHRELRALAERTRFQPQTGDARVTITSRLTEPALSFDGVWISGMHAGAWPRAPRPDPFLPWNLQRAAAMPDASAETNLAQATRLIARWAASANEVIFSWPKRVEEDEALPSALIAPFAANLELESQAPQARAYWRRVKASAAIEELKDLRGPPLPAQVPLAGGARTLTLQSLCAVRAFAERRLGAEAFDRPDPGIDPRTRGKLAHEALTLLWGRLRTQEALLALAAGARHALIAEMSAAVIGQHYRGVQPLPRFARLEVTRLEALLHEWLGIEMARPAFEVVEREAPLAASIGGRAMDLRIDRIDAHPDGRRQVIDYKTGELKPAAWWGDRPDDVQLPLYAVALHPPPDGIAVAQLRTRACSLDGESSAPSLNGGKDQKVAWPVRLAQWRTVIERLVGEFESGDARVNPKNGARTCQNCHLHAFCRIDEIRARDPEDEPEGEDE